MLELTKKVLLRVSFDLRLFRKELLKAKRWLAPKELVLLKSWCLLTFSGQYQELVLEVL